MAKKKVKFDKQYWIDELRSIATTAITLFTIDSGATLLQVYNGDFQKDTLIILLLSAARSLWKAVLTVLLPSLFPPRKSKV